MVGGRGAIEIVREREREVVGGRDIVDERECVCMCSGGGATKVCTIFLSVCLLIHGFCQLDRRDHITVLGEQTQRYEKERKAQDREKKKLDAVGNRKK